MITVNFTASVIAEMARAVLVDWLVGLFIYLFASEFNSIQSKFSTTTGRTDRRTYHTYVCFLIVPFHVGYCSRKYWLISVITYRHDTLPLTLFFYLWTHDRMEVLSSSLHEDMNVPKSARVHRNAAEIYTLNTEISKWGHTVKLRLEAGSRLEAGGQGRLYR